MSRTAEQKRAAFALKRIQGFQGNKDKIDKMATHINKTPIRILSNGLGQALAFLQADNEGKNGNDNRKESGRLFDWIQEWLCGQLDDDHSGRVYEAADQNLMVQLMNGSRDDYVRAQEESLTLFVWLKKFADAGLLGTSEADQSNEAPVSAAMRQGGGQNQARGGHGDRHQQGRDRDQRQDQGGRHSRHGQRGGRR